MIRPAFVLVDLRDCAAFGLRPGTAATPGAWIQTEHGELHVQADGTVELRPTPIPWTRPSVAALPHLPRRP